LVVLTYFSEIYLRDIKNNTYLCSVKNSFRWQKENIAANIKRHFLCQRSREKKKSPTAPRGRSSEHAKAPEGFHLNEP
jgi:hypothetical protein